MKESEKKVTELRDEELGEVAGGRRYEGDPNRGIRTLTCPKCGNSVKVRVGVRASCSCGCLLS